MKFLADTMLGRLARWLRFLGYDTAYRPDLDDGGLARLARLEDRILLTRDVELCRRREVKCLLIGSDRVRAQLHQVFVALNLQTRDAFSRCAECNLVLEELEKEAARGKVPPYIYQTQTRYRACPRCRRVYWRGTHWARIVAELQDMRDEENLT